MLLEFSIDNFRCYKNKMTFNFIHNITSIFGSNASGKTNMLIALERTIRMIKEPGKINKKPLLFSPNNIKKKVSISLKFMDDDNVFLYELSVDKTSIVKEKYTALKFRKLENVTIFSRTANKAIEASFLKENTEKDLINRIMLKNSTFTSSIYSTKIGLHDAILSLYKFIDKIEIIINHDFSNFKESDLLTHIRKNNGNKKQILNLTKLSDPTITDLSASSEDSIICHHDNEKRNFYKESSGTRKTIYMSSILIHAIKKDSIIFLDEIDTHLHPLVLSLWLQEINKINRNNQIVFVGHNPLVVDFLISWRILDDISNIIYLYKDKTGKIYKKEGEELCIEKKDQDKIFSELIYHNWMNYYTEGLDSIYV